MKKNIYTTLVFSIILGAGFLQLKAYDPEFHHHKGIELGEKKLYDKAIQEFDKSIEIYDRESARAYYNRGWAYESTGNYSRAIDNYEEALSRKPELVIAGEKLGKLYYTSEDYINAVRVGEHVMRMDPENKEVPRWLSDAYLKKIQIEKALEEEKKSKEEELKQKDEDRQLVEERLEEELSRILIATYDFTIRTGYIRGDGFEYISTKGLFLNIPERLKVIYTPTDEWDFRFTAENPHLGGATPNITIHSQRIDARYTLGDFKLGAGFMFNHYKGNVVYGSNELWDFKTGIIFGFTRDKVSMDIEFYPRLFPHDNESSTGRTYDTAALFIDYTYIINANLEFYSLMHYRDYYLFNHANEVSSYWGVYDTGIGVTLGNISPDNGRIDFSVSVEYILRAYLENIDNDDPYSSLPNGQSFFGMDVDKWTEGSPFSGFNRFGHILGIKIRENIRDNLFLYQKFSIEVAEHTELNLTIGIGTTIY